MFAVPDFGRAFTNRGRLQTSDETDFVVSQPLEIKQVASDKKLQNNCKTTDALQFPAFEWLYTYTVDSTNETIECFRTSGDSRNIEYTSVYKYEDGEYLLVDEYAEQDGVRVDSHF